MKLSPRLAMVADLVREGVITVDDVGDFSEETLETVKHFI